MILHVDRSMAGVVHRQRTCPGAQVAAKYGKLDQMSASDAVALKILRKSKCARCAEWAKAQ